MLAALVPQQALSSSETSEVSTLVQRAEAADGVSPLNDDARLALRYGGPAVHLLATSGDRVIGYSQLEHPGQEHPSAVLVVDPAHRRVGVGRQLLAATQRAGGGTEAGGPVGFWSFHGLPAAAALARRAGLVRVRELLVMTADLTEPVTVPELPDGVSIRPFVLGSDEEEWLRLNAKAFSEHPEQGQLSLADLQEREREDWFDPNGFLIAVRSGAMVGFHWTKQHPDRLGEVYVLGVDPDAGGRGLGKALLGAGLAHLRRQGNTVVQLYVEAEHERAVGLYLGSGFVESSRDVMYASP